MSYRDDLTALQAHHDALRQEIEEKQRALASSEAILAEAKARAKLPVLDNLRVATPCPADWNQMTGDERVRFCGQCQKNVYNISELTRQEAQQLLDIHVGKLCVRYYQRKDGTILLADCEIGQKRRRKQRRIAGAAAVLFGAGASAGYLQLSRTQEVEAIAGMLVVDPPPPRPVPPYPQPSVLGYLGEVPDPPTAVAGGIAAPEERSPEAEREAVEQTRIELQRELEQAKRKLRKAQRRAGER